MWLFRILPTSPATLASRLEQYAMLRLSKESALRELAEGLRTHGQDRRPRPAATAGSEPNDEAFANTGLCGRVGRVFLAAIQVQSPAAIQWALGS